MAQHQIGFLFLAAGASTRMRGSDKLLKEIYGVPLIQRALNEALKLNFPVFVTVPAYDTERKLIISNTNAVVIEVNCADLGMGHSIATGLTQITKNLNFHSVGRRPTLFWRVWKLEFFDFFETLLQFQKMFTAIAINLRRFHNLAAFLPKP